MLSWIWPEENNNQHKVLPKNKIKFILQGKPHSVHAHEVTPTTTLNDYLRHKLFLFGTKRMCFEGGCGACLVAVTKPGEDKVLAINSCLVAILTCHGWKIDTIEGIGGPVTKYHPIQQALATFNGTQCGFCSPGMVMNMYALCKDGKPTMKDVENSFGGNICRCTGYRPILTAFKSICKDASSDLLGTYPDIEDFCMVQPQSKNNEIITKPIPVEMVYEDSNWTKVYTLKDLLVFLQKAELPYMLVAGNTAKGVYKFPEAANYIDIIEVRELTSYQLSSTGLEIGATTSLNDTISIFKLIAQVNSKYAHLKTMADHIDLIANVPVRNVGSLAGNLMMKYLHNEFPSDIFLILETFGATLIIIDTRGRETVVTMPEFLRFNMTRRVIRAVSIPPLSSDYKYETFKITPRAQNAHAMVNAGMLFRLSSANIVISARIVFGNINPQFIHATATEQYLIGKNLFKNETLQGAFTILEKELKPDFVPPEPDPEFRKQLAISLLYKGILSMAPGQILSPRIKSGSTKLSRPVSSGVQDYETKESMYPLTKPIPKVEALAQSSGQAQYIDDIPDLPHQLYGKFVQARAPPNSTLLKIDATRALACDGVVKFFTKDDIPGVNNFYSPVFGIGVIERLFCDTTVEYYHQPVGLLVGSDRLALDKAADLVKVICSKPSKPPLITIQDILKANATDKIIQERELKPKELGTDIKHTFKGKFELGGQYFFHMELQCCLAVPTENGLTLYSSTQWMDGVQDAMSKVLAIPQNNVYVKVRRCGGAFGAKISRNNPISCAAGLAAYLLKKPVRISLSLNENMEISGKRIPFYAEYEVSVNNGGTIQHLKSKFYADHAQGGNENFISGFLFDMLSGTYNSDPFEIVYYRTRSDNPANTWMRAPGTTEGLCFLESLMDHISYELNIDPLDVRLSNVAKTNTKVVDYLGDLKEWANVDQRKQDIFKFNKENRWKKKGLCVAPMTWAFKIFGPLMTTVSIYHVDGSVSICHGGIEIGQGINTKAIQVCAYKFNIPIEKVNVLPSNTMISANSFVTGGSFTSEAICYGVTQACDELLRRLQPYRTDESQTWVQLVQAAFGKFELLTVNAQHAPNSPNVSPYLIYGACASEVEIDVLTGQHELTRVDIVEDTGTSLNPFIDIGQVEGAFIMGTGYYTSEKLVYSKEGKMLTNNTWYYKPPGAKDIPVDFRIKFPKNNPNPLGILNSKATGEPAVCLSASVPLAIRNALASARTDANAANKKFIEFDGPTTVDFTFMKSLNDFKQYTF